MLPPRRVSLAGPVGARNSIERWASFVWPLDPLAIIWALVVSLLDKVSLLGKKCAWLLRRSSRPTGRRRGSRRETLHGGAGTRRRTGRIIILSVMVLVATSFQKCLCGKPESGGAPARVAATKVATQQAPHGASIAGPLGISSCERIWPLRATGLQPPERLLSQRRRRAFSNSGRLSQQRRRKHSSPSCRSATTRAVSRWVPSTSPPCVSASSCRSSRGSCRRRNLFGHADAECPVEAAAARVRHA